MGLDSGTREDPSCVDESVTMIVDLSDADDIKSFNEKLCKIVSGVPLKIVSKGAQGTTGTTCLESGEAHQDQMEEENCQHNTESYAGLFYRRELPYLVELRSDDKLLGSALITMPNNSPISYVPFTSGPFVKTTHDVEFNNGMLTSWETDRPSEVLAVAGMPLRVLDAVIKSVTQFFQLRINQVDQQTKYTKAQAELLSELVKLRKAQEAQQGMQ